MEFVDEPTPVSRLQNKMSVNDILNEGVFTVENNLEEMDNIDELLDETDPVKVFGSKALQDYFLTEAVDYEDDEEGGDCGTTPFEAIKRKMIKITDDEKIMKKMEKRGNGILPKEGNMAFIHYAAYVEFGQFPFDVTYLRQPYPFRFRLGTSSVILGLDMAVKTMSKGECSFFLIHPDYAWGEKGVAPRIPPNATVLIKVELIGFDECSLGLEEEEENRAPKTFDEILKIANKLHTFANEQQNNNNLYGAIKCYRKALNLLLAAHLKNNQEETTMKLKITKLYTNLAICHNKLGRYKYVNSICKSACRDAKEEANKNAKLFYQWSKALRRIADYDEALIKIKKANLLCPNDMNIRKELRDIEHVLKISSDNEKKFYQRALSSVKITEVEENPKNDKPVTAKEKADVEQSIIKEIKYFLQFLKNSEENKQIKVPDGLTKEELEIYKSICEEMGLSLKQIRHGSSISHIITK